MPLFKNIIGKENAKEVAINYEPKVIGSQLSEQAILYVDDKKKRGDFRVDKVVAEYTGIDELEKLSQQRELEEEAIKLSRSVQEDAYKEAYELGKVEGTKVAYEEEKARIDEEIKVLQDLVNEIKNFKVDLLKENEHHIVRLTFYLAKRLLMKEIVEDDNYVKELIRRSLEMAQSEEEVTIRLCPEDYKFISENKEEFLKELHLDATTKLEEDVDVKRGGVVVETNYGVIDATIDQRLEKMEELLNSQMSS
ncbi:MAG: hypothetical protein KDD33_02700 [Bdellovibrionales bacterium]|nr:hypothetical protein [Bdellovibrionales bacterium]